MAEEKIAERIDANLMNITLDELKVIDRETFNSRFDKIKKKTQGRLIIKEYPTATAHSGHFRALLEELRIKKDFIPDLIIIDYLNICASARMKMGASVNSYTYIKSIAEELRGLAVEYNVPILSSTQTNRQGYDNSDVDLSNVSESAGLSSTADLVIAVIRTEELDELDQLMIKQLKNRYSDPSKYKRFVVGVDRAKMKLYDVEASAQTLADSGMPEEDTNTQWKGKPKPSFGDFKY
jgi:replicative DNA helicase